jgi:acetyltransferase-like isoleucine patch superfamily enzyme
MFKGEAFLHSLLYRKKISVVGKKFRILRPRIITNGKYISIGDNFWCWDGLRMTAIDSCGMQKFTPTIVIGNNVNLMFDIHITCINKIEIHDDVLIASRVFITDHQHGSYSNLEHSDPNIAPVKRLLRSGGPVVIGEKSWIGEGVVVLPNVSIGEGSIIGSNSVVTKSIPSYSIAIGVPARVIKKYDFHTKKWVTC